MIDIHSHVLPGIDDGASDLAMAIAMCEMAEKDGTRTLVATPHMFCDVGNPSPSTIQTACRALQETIGARGIALELRWAAEIRLVEDISARLQAGEIPSLDGKGRYVLLEVPRMGDCAEALGETIFRLRLRGVVPVVAHPERVEVFLRPENADLAERVVDQGALLQLTAQSIVNAAAMGRPDFTVGLLRRGLVHVVASDAHDLVRRPPLLSRARAVCGEWLGEDQASRLFESNPAAIIAGGDTVQLQPAEIPGMKASPRGRSSASYGRWRGLANRLWGRSR